jgi:glycosyltransferase involved in cell wall biosynthesis
MKIRIAFIKFAGLSAGGTEKFLQTIAANLDKEKFEVDYYYCDSAPYKGSDYFHAGTDKYRKEYLLKHGVNLIEFTVGLKDVETYTHEWIGTNFWNLFDESKYDIIQTGRAGHAEYPFCNIKHTPIVDSIHTLAGVDNQYNIARVMHITKWSADKWIKMGGDKERVVFVSHPMEIHAEVENMRSELLLGEAFVFGFHQRVDDNIFSDIPLQAYAKIESDSTYFVIMGGSPLYSKQAKDLGIKNFIQLPHSGNPQTIYSFLQTLNVYAHGRKDGELNSTAMAEAMYFGLPIVSHYSSMANGHVECIADAGLVVHTISEYADELKKFLQNKEYLSLRSKNSKNRFKNFYELKGQMKKISEIYESVIQNPFPYKGRRALYHVKEVIKRILYNRYSIIIYRKMKLLKNKI